MISIILQIAAVIFVIYYLFNYIMGKIAGHYDNQRTSSMVFLKIGIPKKDSKEDRDRDSESTGGNGDFKDTVGIMAQFFESLYSIYSSDYKSTRFGQDYLSFEYAVQKGLIYFYVVCPAHLVKVIDKKLTAFYPDVSLEEVQDYNLFSKDSVVDGTYVYTEKESVYPIKNYKYINFDPLNDITNSLSKLESHEGAAIQIMLRPAAGGWQSEGRKLAQSLLNDKGDDGNSWFKPLEWIRSTFDLILKGADAVGGGNDMPAGADRMTQLREEEIKAIDEKNAKIGYEVIIRVLVASDTKAKASQTFGNIMGSFAQFSYIDGNGFATTKYHSMSDFIRSFVDRSFSKPFPLNRKPNMILSPDEIASLFHLPNIRYNRAPNISWQNYKIAPLPDNIPTEGILLGHNTYRGVTKEIRMKNEDRFRHFYVIGQTGTGKSSIFQSMIRQDLKNGAGLCVIDPHGSLVDDILPHIPKERADDVIYFNPADTERPMGLNLLEAHTEAEKDMVALDAMNIMIKMFDEEIFGPRIQDYFRNGCLTLMDDPEGGSLTDIVRLFTDDAFQKIKVDHVKNPIVKSFWTNQMANTGQREKQEMIPYFAAKFGAFITNTMMRNIIGQTKSAFDFSTVMQEGKILLMNLSKGMTGDINSKLLGLIIVSKLQMAALRRQTLDKADRKDFYLYIDEFQNYITDSIESILSEARKYRLSLNLAHQYIGQLVDGGDESIKNAVFGNVGTMMCYKISATDAEFMAKEMAPVFSDQDLVNIDKFKAVMKLSIDTQPSKPFSITPLNPYTDVGDKAVGEAFKQLSRLKYGRDVEFVNREILRRVGV
jgi:hypothetical protein